MTKKNIKPNPKTRKINRRISYKFIKNVNKKTQKKLPKILAVNNTKNHKLDRNNLDKIIFDDESIKKNNNNYSIKLSICHLNSYANNFLTDILRTEANINRKNLNEQILYNYNIKKENRKNSVKYFYNFIKYHKINIKCYFSSVSMFDIFLINYSKDKFNVNNCKYLFVSKITNKITETKIVILLLCCYYISSKYLNTNLITFEQILQFEDAKSEVNYDDLLDLVDKIIMYSDLKNSFVNIYNFIEIYMLDIMQRVKELSKSIIFRNFEDFTLHFTTKIIQDADLLNIARYIQAFAIIIFSFEYSKLTSEEKNEQLNSYLIQWKNDFKEFAINYDLNGFNIIINWLNDYISK
jgi:hypothetical protein